MRSNEVCSCPRPGPAQGPESRSLVLTGRILPELWNSLGAKVLPKVRSHDHLRAGVGFAVTMRADSASSLETELRQILDDLGSPIEWGLNEPCTLLGRGPSFREGDNSPNGLLMRVGVGRHERLGTE